MSTIILEVVAIAALIVLNGVFAMSELAVMSARKARLRELSNSGSHTARVALDLAESPDRFLSTVQIGITLVGVLAGAFGGATIARALGDWFNEIEPLARYSSALGLGIVVATITYLSLIVGELVPKRLALQNPERVASLVALPMHWLSRLAFPLVRFLSLSTNLLLKVLGVRQADDRPVSEEEIRIMIEEGAQAGVFRLDEQDMVESVFRLDDQHINALMTPHTEITWLEADDTPDEIRDKIATSGHSRFPVCRDGLDHVLGIVRAQHLLADCLAGRPVDLLAHATEPRFVPETATASRIVDLFRHSDDHLILVIDEHGSIQGLITEHDVLEAIVGDIPSWGESVEPEAVQRADGSWLLDGLMNIDEAKELLGIANLPDDERNNYQTLGGFIMSRLGVIPTTGACFRWGGFRFEVVDMDGRRVDKILAARDPGADGSRAEACGPPPDPPETP